MQLREYVMRYHDEEDPKQPRPLGGDRKGLHAWESEEAGDWRKVGPARKDHDRDRHRHVRL